MHIKHQHQSFVCNSSGECGSMRCSQMSNVQKPVIFMPISSLLRNTMLALPLHTLWFRVVSTSLFFRCFESTLSKYYWIKWCNEHCKIGELTIKCMLIKSIQLCFIYEWTENSLQYWKTDVAAISLRISSKCLRVFTYFRMKFNMFSKANEKNFDKLYYLI